MENKIIFKLKPEIKKYPYLGYWEEKLEQSFDVMDWLYCNLFVLYSILAAAYVWAYILFIQLQIFKK